MAVETKETTQTKLGQKRTNWKSYSKKLERIIESYNLKLAELFHLDESANDYVNDSQSFPNDLNKDNKIKELMAKREDLIKTIKWGNKIIKKTKNK